MQRQLLYSSLHTLHAYDDCCRNSIKGPQCLLRSAAFLPIYDHTYTRVKKGTMRIRCLAREHSNAKLVTDSMFVVSEYLDNKSKLEKVIFRYMNYTVIRIKTMYSRKVSNSVWRHKKYTHEKRQSSLLNFNPLLREGVRRLM